jgi:hypothetical protein
LNLPVSGLYLLTAPSTPAQVIEIAVERSQAGERRNITTGQKAMAHAMLHREVTKNRRKGSSSGKPEDTSKGHWFNLISQARTVLVHAPALAEKVRDGFPLNEAYEVARQERQNCARAARFRAALSADPPQNFLAGKFRRITAGYSFRPRRGRWRCCNLQHH